MPTNIPSFSLALVCRAMDLANKAYSGISAFNGVVMEYYNTINSKHHPAFFVVRDKDALFVVVRGSKTEDDWNTNFDYLETTAYFGGERIFCHTGFYKSGKNIFNEIKDRLKEEKGKVYIVGHSLGGSTATVLGSFVGTDVETKKLNFGVIAFGPAPALGFIPRAIYDRFVSIVNEDDIIPTLSVPSIYNLYSPLITSAGVPKVIISMTLKASINVINVSSSTMSTMLCNAAFKNIDRFVDDLDKYHRDKSHLSVKYLAGMIYHLKSDNDIFSSSIVSPSSLNKLVISVTCTKNHRQNAYITRLNKMR